MRFRTEGFGDVLVRLDQDIHTLETIARNGRCGDSVQTAVSRAHQRIFADKGRNLQETTGRVPWGQYARSIGTGKQEGQTYTLIDTSDLIYSLIDVYTMARLQTEREMQFGTDVEYAAHVHEKYGAIVGIDRDLPGATARAIVDWWLADSRSAWERVS